MSPGRGSSPPFAGPLSEAPDISDEAMPIDDGCSTGGIIEPSALEATETPAEVDVTAAVDADAVNDAADAPAATAAELATDSFTAPAARVAGPTADPAEFAFPADTVGPEAEPAAAVAGAEHGRPSLEEADKCDESATDGSTADVLMELEVLDAVAVGEMETATEDVVDAEEGAAADAEEVQEDEGVAVTGAGG